MKKLSIVLFLLCAVNFTYSAPINTPTISGSKQVDSAHPSPFRAGDALEITTYPDTVAFPSGFYPIDGDGYTDFPIIGYTKVTEMSVSTLTTYLAEKYVDYMRYPTMSVRPMIRVTLQGGFFQPGLYWVSPNASLWDALKVAGGTQRTDGCRKLKWERDNKVVSNNLVPFLESGQSLYQIGFQSGDQITVLQQQYRTKWDIFRGDVIPLLTTAASITISIMTLAYLIQKN